MKYLLIHVADETRQPDPDDLDGKAALVLADWIEEMVERGVLVHGDRLRPVSDATTVGVNGGEVVVFDGPFAETKEQIAGYDVIDCADLDEAIEIAAKHPTALIGRIEVRPFWFQ
ncbi:MAG TPA: YciI family protein [Pseudonocardiaceae bacterium]|nr:YciI family protein [Pseudonocardiaceae bacterium]